MIHLHYTAIVVPYVRVGRERWTDRASRYLASKDALALAIRQARTAAGVTGPADDQHMNWAVTLAVRRKSRRHYDLDNVVKAVMDAANGIVWADDRQVSHLGATKHGPGEDSMLVVFWLVPTTERVA